MTVTSENLIATVQRLVDQDEIHRVLYDYGFHLDAADPEKMLTLFTPDAKVSYGPRHGGAGADDYLHTLANDKTGIAAFFAGTSHHVSNVVIDFIDADRANVRSVVYAYHKYNRERSDGIVYGQYHDEFVRTSDGWKIKNRELKHTGIENYHQKGDALNPAPRNNRVEQG